MDSVDSGKFNRRALLLGAVVLVGGGIALTRFGRRPDDRAKHVGPVFSAEQFALLEQISDTIIPTTDTPGAIAAGVPVFIRDMLGNWGNQATRDELAGVLEAIEKKAWDSRGAPFLELPAEPRLEVMSAFDEHAVRQHDPAYRKFKQLVLLGYYHSEIGATQELRFELVPGAWRSCLPLIEVGRAAAFVGQ